MMSHLYDPKALIREKSKKQYFNNLTTIIWDPLQSIYKIQKNAGMNTSHSMSNTVFVAIRFPKRHS